MADGVLSKNIEKMFQDSTKKSLGAICGISVIMHANGSFDIQTQHADLIVLSFCGKILENYLSRQIDQTFRPVSRQEDGS